MQAPSSAALVLCSVPDGSGFFFADPDPGFKSPDPSINKLVGSK